MVTFVGSDSCGGNATDTSALAGDARLIWPTVQPDDVAVLFWTFVSTATATTPSGFTHESTNDVGDGGGTMRTAVYWKVCSGSEDGTVLATVVSALNRQSACLVVYRDVDTADPIAALAVDIDHAGETTTHTNPAVTPPVGNCVILASVHERATSIDADWTAPSGYTERADSLTLATGSGGSITAVADDGLAAGRDTSAVTPPVWTGDHVTGTDNILTYSVALRPSSSTVTGVASASLAFTASAAGVREVGGAASASLAFTASAVGVRTVDGAAVASLGFTAGSAGTRTVLGSASAALGFSASAAGMRTVQGAGSSTLAFTATASGTTTRLGVAAANLGFTASASGVREVLGVATAALGFTAAASGVVDSAGEVNGAALAELGFTASATGVRTVLATASATLGLTAAAAGERTVNGSASADLGFIGTATGTLNRLGQATAVLLFTATASGHTVDDLTAAAHAVSASQPAQYVTSGLHATVTGSAPVGAVRRTA